MRKATLYILITLVTSPVLILLPIVIIGKLSSLVINEIKSEIPDNL